MTQTCDRCGCLFLASGDEKTCAACLTTNWGGGGPVRSALDATRPPEGTTKVDGEAPTTDAALEATERTESPGEASAEEVPAPNRWVGWMRGDASAGPWWKAFAETVRDCLQGVESFFDALRGRVHVGGHRYFLLGSVVPQAVSLLLVMLLPVGLPDLLAHVASKEDPSGPVASMLPFLPGTGSDPGGAIAGLLVLPLAGLISIYLGSLISHGVLLLLGRRGAGWEETRQLFLFAEGTAGPLHLVPVFGGLLASLASVWLETVGVARVHRIGLGPALMATLGWRLVLMCCCAAPIAMVMAQLANLALLPVHGV